MAKRYVLRDSHYEHDPSMRDGSRFASLERAAAELSHSVPAGRFYIWDREARERIDSLPMGSATLFHAMRRMGLPTS